MPDGAAGAATGIVLIVIIVVGSILLAVYPVYPRITGTINIQSSNHQIGLLGVKLDRVTIAAAASVKKNALFIYSIQNETTGTTFSLTIELSYAGQDVVPLSIWDNIHTGIYSFSAVLDPRSEQSGVFYHAKVTANFPYAQPVVMEFDVPPS